MDGLGGVGGWVVKGASMANGGGAAAAAAADDDDVYY